MARSARTASLYEQRNRYVSRKVLKPGSLRSNVNTIARKMADAEFENMVKQYNDGVIGNERMYSYLESALGSDLFTSKEKVDISDRLRDFEGRVEGDRLEAIYQASQGENKVEAANNLAEFYRQRADEMEVGTPAHSNSLNDAAGWLQKAQAEKESINKQERRVNRAQKEFELSSLPDNEFDTLQQKAQAYADLAQQAAADGEQVEAYELGSKAQDITANQIPKLQEKEAKDTLTNAFQQLKDMYHDGEISPLDAASAAKQIDNAALEAGFYEMSSGVNDFADGLQRDIEKGREYGDINGLQWSVRKGDSEWTATVKQWRERFALEEDTFRALKRQIDQDPVAASRLLKQINLYSAYMTGFDLQGNQVDEFVGLPARMEMFQVLHDNTDGDYTNEIRDVDAKLTGYGDELAQVTYQYSSLVGDEGQDVVNTVTQSVLPEGVNYSPGLGRNQGVLITYDEFGNEYEKPITLNAEMQNVDPSTGQALIEGTYVGRDVAVTPDGRYVKLQPYYSTEAGRSANIPDFYYTLFDGKYYVKRLQDEQIMPASELAAEDDAVREWYTPKIEEEAMNLERFYQSHPDKRPVQEQATESGIINLPVPPQPPLQESVFGPIQDQTATFEPLTSEQAKATKPVVPKAPQIDYTQPAEASAGRGEGMWQLPTYSAANDINLSQYQNIPYTPPSQSYQFLPPTVITPSTTQGQIKQQDPLVDIGQQYQQPNPIQQSGQKEPYKPEYAPDTSDDLYQTPQSKLVKGVGNAVSGAWNWLKGLF